MGARVETRKSGTKNRTYAKTSFKTPPGGRGGKSGRKSRSKKPKKQKKSRHSTAKKQTLVCGFLKEESIWTTLLGNWAEFPTPCSGGSPDGYSFQSQTVPTVCKGSVQAVRRPAETARDHSSPSAEGRSRTFWNCHCRLCQGTL